MPVYAVARGRKTGVYHTWDDCKANVNSYSNARYKKFNTVAEANAFINKNLMVANGSELYPGSHPYSRPRKPTPKKELESGSYAETTSPTRAERSVPVSFMSGCDTYPTSKSEKATSIPNKRAVYVDGASRGNGRSIHPASGYGVYYGENDPRNAAVPISKTPYSSVAPTNQRAELLAIKHAVADIATDLSKGGTDSYAIYSDSMYAQKCITEWAIKWQASGWKNSKNVPVANRDIIEPILPTIKYINQKYQELGLGELTFHHVKGHNGDPGNEEADRLANLGADLDSK